MCIYIYIYIYTSVSPCIKCTEKPWNTAYRNITYRIWVHSLPHSGDLRMHEHSDEPFANLVQGNRTCKYKEKIVNMEWPSNTFGKMRNAKTQSFQGHGVDNELGLRTSCKDSISKPDLWTQRKWIMTSSLSEKESIQTQQKRSTQRGCTINEMGGCRHVC